MARICKDVDTRSWVSALNGSSTHGNLSRNGNLTICDQAYYIDKAGTAMNCNLKCLATMFGTRNGYAFRCHINAHPDPTSSPKS